MKEQSIEKCRICGEPFHKIIKDTDNVCQTCIALADRKRELNNIKKF